jgi:general stress protein 26
LIDNGLYQQISGGDRTTAHFTSKGHDVWATLHGTLSTSQDRATIDRLWNRFVAAWYEGNEDSKIGLIRLDPENAEIWIDASSVVARIKMLLGIDPKEDYKDKVAEVSL